MNIKHFACAVAVAAMGMYPAPAMAQIDDSFTDREWIASGQIGSAFGATAEDATPGFGGSLTYLHERALGAEVLAGFTPDLDLGLAPTDDTAVSNVIELQRVLPASGSRSGRTMAVEPSILIGYS